MLAVLGTVIAVLGAFALVRLSGGGPPADTGLPTPPPPPDVGLGPAPTPSAAPSPSPSPTPDASPEPAPPPVERGSGVCPPFPRFPDETCTGYRHTGVTLRSCPNVITQDGAELDGCRFSGGLEIQARDVTITRSLVDGGVVYATYLTDFSLGGLRLIDVEIDGGGTVEGGMSAAIGSTDYTCIRCHIHSSERGANLDFNVHIEESYLHGWIEQEGAHQTAIGSNGGSNFTILHNNLQCETAAGCSSALSLYEDFRPIDDVLIQQNLFNTTGGYCTYAGQDGTNIRYIDNVFGTAFSPRCAEYGPVTGFQANEGNVWRGNRYPDGTPVRPDGQG